MRFNPCGRVVDWLRAPYTTQCRFWEDSDQEVTINWYPAADGVPCLPFPTVFSSRHWSTWREYTLDGPGEVFGEETYSPKRANPDATGRHICGTPDDFAGHAKRDPNPPFQRYDANQLPTCCGAPEPLEANVAIDFLPELVTPCIDVAGGNSSGTATPINLDTLYCLGPTTELLQQWWKITLPANDNWFVCFPDTIQPNTSIQLHGVVGFIQMFPGDQCIELLGVGPGDLLISETDGTAPQLIKMHAGIGTCAANCP